MRIGIREQLSLLNLLTTLIALAVVAIATWLTNYRFVVSVRSSGLSLTASLFAQQLSSNLETMQASVEAVATRVLIQSALARYNAGNTSASNWVQTAGDLQAAIGRVAGTQSLIQAQIFPKNDTGFAGPYSLVNETSVAFVGRVPVLAPNSDGTTVPLESDGTEYTSLYPNLTYSSQVINSTFNMSMAFYKGTPVTHESMLFLGPSMLNRTFGLASITTPIVNNTANEDVLGFLTIVLDAGSIIRMAQATQGLGDSGQLLIIAPNTPDQRLPNAVQKGPSTRINRQQAQDLQVHFVVRPVQNSSRSTRHASRAFGTRTDPNFPMTAYPAVVDAYVGSTELFADDNSLITTTNEDGEDVSVGYSTTLSPLVDWAIIVEESHGEVWAPIHHLRNLLLACVFATAGVLGLLIFPIAHFSVTPIRRLRSATRRTVDPQRFPSDDCSFRSFSSDGHDAQLVDDENGHTSDDGEKRSKIGIVSRALSWRKKPRTGSRKRMHEEEHRKFRIPGKVRDPKHVIHDELTDLTRTFNEMSEELTMQYARLEERVKERTAELEMSKKAAEIANEAKTLFIANISHELKTPLNGIMGMCTVSMQETDTSRIRRSLEIIYRSGDLLLHLLTDLLTFTKNQIGQQLSLDQREFRLDDVSVQIASIFAKQALENNITLTTNYVGRSSYQEGEKVVLDAPGEEGYGPAGTGRLKSMQLWGDQHRILQVMINLVSNSLKFTPSGGSVDVRIRCLGDAPQKDDSRVGSIASKQSKQASFKASRKATVSRVVSATSSTLSHSRKDRLAKRLSDTPLQINGVDPRSAHAGGTLEASAAPMPLGARNLLFEFEVADTGPGIPADQQAKVFEPFMQGDLGLSKKYGGTGLGLSICSQLAKLMKGDLRLESEVGKGCKFTMQIPLAFIKEEKSQSFDGSGAVDAFGKSPGEEALAETKSETTATDSKVKPSPATLAVPPAIEPPIQPRLIGLSKPFFASSTSVNQIDKNLAAVERVAAQAVQSGAKVRVLVAEDNAVNQEVVLRMLKLEDIYDVTVAKDGQEAFELVRESMEQKRFFDLIFMDVQMPNLDGIQSTKLIRQMGYSAPIVALTAFAEESNVKECMDSGMNYFLPKPIRRPQLKQVLKRYCAPIPEAIEEGDKTSPSDNGKADAKLPNGIREEPATDSTKSANKDAGPEKRDP